MGCPTFAEHPIFYQSSISSSSCVPTYRQHQAVNVHAAARKPATKKAARIMATPSARLARRFRHRRLRHHRNRHPPRSSFSFLEDNELRTIFELGGIEFERNLDRPLGLLRLELERCSDRLSIGKCAFEGSRLREAILSGAWCMEIHSYAFNNCAYLEKVALSSAIEYENKIFSNCTGLTEVSIDDCEEPYNITYEMFRHCKALERIELPAGLKNIESQAFYGSGLRSVTLPASLKRIENQAFGECLNLTTVRFLGDYCEIEDNVFRDCVNLRNIRANSSPRNSTTSVATRSSVTIFQ